MTTKTSRRGQKRTDAHAQSAASAPDSPPAIVDPTPNVRPRSGFNLRGLIREVVRRHESPDPYVVTAKVFAEIPAAEYEAALRQSLDLLVHEVMRDERPTEPFRPQSNPTGKSAKVAAIRDNWQRGLDSNVHTADGYKFLRDCTYDDLLFAAAERQKHADQNAAWARTYNNWAAALTEHAVQTFGDLPVEVQATLLGRAA